MSNKIIINFCPTGLVPTQEMNPNVPISPAEIIEQTHQAYELGITIAHLHARHADQSPAYQPEIYQRIIEGVRKYCPELIVCLSTSGRNFPEFEKRSAVMELYPDMCSLTLSSLNFLNAASLNTPEMIQALLEKMLAFGIHPELECFDLGMINYGNYLIKKYQLTAPIYWNLIVGNIFGAQPQFSQLGAMLEQIPTTHYVSLGGVGEYQLETNALAIAKGLGVRVGLEDNLWFDLQRSQAASNQSLLQRVHALMQLQQKELMPSRDLNLYNRNRSAIAKT